MYLESHVAVGLVGQKSLVRVFKSYALTIFQSLCQKQCFFQKNIFMAFLWRHKNLFILNTKLRRKNLTYSPFKTSTPYIIVFQKDKHFIFFNQKNKTYKIHGKQEWKMFFLNNFCQTLFWQKKHVQVNKTFSFFLFSKKRFIIFKEHSSIPNTILL